MKLSLLQTITQASPAGPSFNPSILPDLRILQILKHTQSLSLSPGDFQPLTGLLCGLNLLGIIRKGLNTTSSSTPNTYIHIHMFSGKRFLLPWHPSWVLLGLTVLVGFLCYCDKHLTKNIPGRKAFVCLILQSSPVTTGSQGRNTRQDQEAGTEAEARERCCFQFSFFLLKNFNNKIKLIQSYFKFF